MKKVVLVTGASSGIGKEIAKLYLEKDYSLILSGRNEQGFDYVKGNKNVDVVLGDITESETRKKIKDLVVKKYNKLDILVSNAGIILIQPFEESSEELLESIYSINLKTPILLIHEFYDLMKSQKNGTIIFINSAVGKQGYPNHSLYAATKFGLTGFSQSLRLEAKKYGIRVLSIHPGGMNTNLFNNVKNKPDISSYMNPKKVAEIVVFLSETSELSPDDISISRTTK